MALQRHILKHLQRRKAHYRRRHSPRDKNCQWNSLYLEESSASESLLPPDRQTKSPPNIRVPLGSLYLPALSHVSCSQVSNSTNLLLRYFLKFLVAVVHSATTVLFQVPRNYCPFCYYGFFLSSIAIVYALLCFFCRLRLFHLLEKCATFAGALRTLVRLFLNPTRELFARHQILSANQNDDESIVQFSGRLKRLVEDCECTSLSVQAHKDYLVRDALLSGLRSDDIRARHR